MIKFSKKIDKMSSSELHGKVLGYRHGKYIICGGNVKPVGVFNLESRIRVTAMSGEVFDIKIPAGIISMGKAKVKRGG